MLFRSNGNSHEVEDWLIREEVDVAFLSAPAPAGVQSIPLTEEPLVAVLPPEHPLTRYDRVPVTLAAKEPIISLLDRSAQDMNRIWSSAEIVPNVHYSVKDDYAVFAMVSAGLGISIMPRLVLKGVTNQVVTRELSPLPPGPSPWDIGTGAPPPWTVFAGVWRIGPTKISEPDADNRSRIGSCFCTPGKVSGKIGGFPVYTAPPGVVY